jgi:hypothetical protein
MKLKFYAAAVIALSAATFLPSQAMAQVDISVVIGNAPPAPRFESAPQPRRGYVWAPGYWNWDGQGHAWTAGRWETQRDGYQYRRAEWKQDNGAWRLDRGGWNASGARPVSYEYADIAPPRARFERTPRPRAGYIWTSGHWDWRGQRHQWVPGVWIAERPGYGYVSANWAQRDGRWYLEPGRWSHRDGERNRDGGSYRRGNDSDRDGIPNRVDRDRDGDGVQNRFDRDRDGDGVPNRFDSQPNNPRR